MKNPTPRTIIIYKSIISVYLSALSPKLGSIFSVQLIVNWLIRIAQNVK